MITPERARELIAASFSETDPLTPDDIAELVSTNEATLWLGKDSIIVTEITDYPRSRKRILQVLTAGGNLKELRDDLRPKIEAYGRKHGCTHAIDIPTRSYTNRVLIRACITKGTAPNIPLMPLTRCRV